MAQEQSQAQTIQDHVIVLGEPLVVVEELLAAIAKPSLEIHRTTQIDEASRLAFAHSPCLVICNVGNAQAINPTVTLLRKIFKGIKKGSLKTMVLSSVKNPQLKQLVAELGVTDYIMDSIPTRTLQFKFNLQINAILAIRKREALLNNTTELVFKQDEKRSNDPSITFKTAVYTRKPSLKLPEDCFAMGGNLPKKSGKKFLFELQGPNPESGSWEKMPAQKPDEKPRYRWVPNDPKAIERRDPSTGWVHEGDEPVFDAENKRWNLTSERPDLSYVRNNIKQSSKVSLNANGIPEVTDDSPQALAKISLQDESAPRPEIKVPDESVVEMPEEPKGIAPTENAKTQADGLEERHQPETEATRGEAPQVDAPVIAEAPAAPGAETPLSRQELMRELHRVSLAPLVEPTDEEASAIESELAVPAGSLSKKDLAKRKRAHDLQKLRNSLENKIRPAPTVEREAVRAEEPAAKVTRIYFKTNEELEGDRESTWVSCGAHFIYLTAEHRGRDMRSVRGTMPLWIFSGQEAPEFADGRWRFLGSSPRKMTAVKDLPSDAQDFVRALRDTVRDWNKGKAPADRGLPTLVQPGDDLLNSYERALAARNPQLRNTLIARRKRQTLQPQAEPAERPEVVEQNSSEERPLSAFLASLQVLVSDAVLKRKPLSEKAGALCVVMAKVLKFCHVSLLTPAPSEWDERGAVLGSTRSDKTRGDEIAVLPNAQIAEKPHLLASIYGVNSRQLIGYIFLERAATRTHFSDFEAEIVNRYAEILAPYWEESLKQSDRRAA